MRMPTDNQRPARTPFGPSDRAPLSTGPTHCPIPNAIVSAAIAAVQACGLAAFRANEVTAATTASTDPPKRIAERYALVGPCQISGNVAPAATVAIVALAPQPPFRRASMGPHANAATTAARPRIAQKAVIDPLSKPSLVRKYATINVA